MSPAKCNPSSSPCLFWLRAMNELVHGQLNWIEAQYRLGASVLDALGAKSTKLDVRRAKPEMPQSLESRARERMQKGLPPPREVYDAQNRGRIDWTSAPDWARPVDPELFEGCGHEG
jgi:hypothetical protein